MYNTAGSTWYIFICLILMQNASALTVQNLGGTWRVSNAEQGYDLPATVPGGIYTDLMKNDIIGDVFYGFNDVETRWVSKLDWEYSRQFTVEEELLAYTNINLVFDGIDTFSKILINNVEVGITENMFVRYIFDVKPYLQSGNNQITVQFKSPVTIAKYEFEKQASNYTVPPKCVSKKYNGECHVNHIRKMQASFSWDWGPAFPSVGIWKKVYLEAYNSSVLRDVTIDIFSNASAWDIQINAYLAESFKKGSIQGTLLVEILTDLEKITVAYKIDTEKNKNGDFLTTQNLTIPKANVQLWWPNGYGEAKLYTVNTTFLSLDGKEKNTRTFKIGFRTIELVQDLIDSGRTFYFKVNGLPIFAKGSNSIPINILPELGQNETTTRFLLQSAKDVHMNMLRVWGGGTYESDAFYEMADEMGILIWQDFMFACSMYPTSNDFLRTVREEVKHQVRRLQYHASIALWAGNNENEVALRKNWYGTLRKFSLYKNDYKKLYVDTIKEEVLLSDNTRSYLTSSPTNGVKSDEEEEYVAKDPQSNFYGDVHYYMYLLDSWKTKIYPISRFASEYGFQSLPSVDTLLTATNDIKDLNINSTFLASRQHHILGYTEMQRLINYQLQLPSKNSENFYKAFIFYSQIIQAMSIKIETEYYRQWRSNLNGKGEGLTMGALYWQLNDVWAAPTWAGIDFNNNWKMLHYYAKNFFAPVIVTGDLTNSKLDIYVVSDLTTIIPMALLTVSVFRWDSFDPVHQDILNITITPQVSEKVRTYMIDDYLSNIKDGRCGEDLTKNCFFYFTLKDGNNESIAPDNHVFPHKLKSSNLQKPTVQISNIQQIGNTTEQFAVEIKTNTLALFVWLDAKGIRGRFSENGFLQVSPIKTVYFNPDLPITIDDLQRSITVTNLLDNEFI